jgi:hypothetical protein
MAVLLAACGRSSESSEFATTSVAAPTTAPANAKPIIAAAAPAPAASAASTMAAGSPLAQDAYVWQRVWMPAHAEALKNSRTLFSELRVLAAQQHPKEGWVEAHVDLATLAADGRAVRAVIRLDGRLNSLNVDAIATAAHDILLAWRAAGVNVVGVEIDFDCASSRLGEYAKLLSAIRAKHPAGTTLSVTVLPAWINAPKFDAVLMEADEAVLQVHAVTDPKHGLFDPKQARQWIDAFAHTSAKVFRVALPAYGSALVLDAQGRVIGVESEAPLPEPGARLELFADPAAVAGLLRDLDREHPFNLRGIVWFRLPLPGDRRAWPLTTIEAVIAGRELHSAWTPEVSDGGNGAFDIAVRNAGNIEAKLPASVEIGGNGCKDADALPGYRIERGDATPQFVRETNASLPATQTRPIGWVRCTHLLEGDVHVHP